MFESQLWLCLHFWFIMALYYKMQQILKNATVILLQNTTKVYYKFVRVSVCVCVCVCVCLFVQRPLLFPYNGGRMRVLSSISKADQADFTDWMSFLPSNLMEEINSNTKALNANT